MKEFIICDSCGSQINVDEALSKKYQEASKNEYEQKLKELNNQFLTQKKSLQEEKLLIEKQKEKIDDYIKIELKRKLDAEKEKILKETQESFDDKIKLLENENEKRKIENDKLKQQELLLIQKENEFDEKEKNLKHQMELEFRKKQEDWLIEAKQKEKEIYEIELQKIKNSTKNDFENKLNSLETELKQKEEENKKIKQIELELLKKNQELKTLESDLKFNLEKDFLERQNEIEEKARQKAQESFELEKTKLLKQIDDNKKLAEEMKRKAEQSSQQLQGEVQELALEFILSQSFPYDNVSEVSKGTRGADLIQEVFNSNRKSCGKIIFESKRVKSFSNEWIEKLKNDQLIEKADIAVIVSEVYPRGMDRFGEINGIWVCNFQEVKSLVIVLREVLIRSESVKIAQSNKGDKAELLYEYLLSNQFVQNVTRIIESYDNMQQSLTREKRAMEKLWKEREKQMWVIHENLSGMFGSIKGIAGSELKEIALLEL